MINPPFIHTIRVYIIMSKIIPHTHRKITIISLRY